MEQLVDKAYTAILQTGLYETPCAKFKGILPKNQTYSTLKEHMLQAYELWLQMGVSSCPSNSLYYGTHNAINDDSIERITKPLTNMQLANNATTRTINKNISTITCKTMNLRNIVAQLQQQQANMSIGLFTPLP